MTNRSFYVETAHRLAFYLEQELGLRRGHGFRFVKVVPSFKILTLWLSINPTYTKRVMGMTKELSQAAALEKGNFIRGEWGGRGVVELQIPKPLYLWTSPQVNKLARQAGIKTAVGLDTENETAIADFSNPVTSHCLVSGLSGCGKTELQRLLVYQLAMQNQANEVRFLLFDVADAGLAWSGFDNLPHLIHGVIADTKTGLAGTEWLQAEMERRAGARQNTPKLFAFVDEIQELAHQKQFVGPVEALARRGRKWGITLVLATQRPTKDSMGSMNIKANLGLRIVGKVTSGQESLWATDLPESGAETLLGPGDMLMASPGGIIQRIAIPMLSNENLAKLPTNGDNRLEFTEESEAEEEALTGDFGAQETAISLLAAHYGKGRPWLKDALQAETGSKPGSGRARRLLASGKEINSLLYRYHHKLVLTG